MSDKVLNTIGIVGLTGICSSIFVFNIFIFVPSTVLVVFFIVISSINIGVEPMNYQELMDSVASIMSTEKTKLIETQDTSRLSYIIEELDRLKRPDLMTSITGRFASNVESSSPEIRYKTARVFRKIAPVMQKAKFGDAYISVNKAFIDAESTETDRSSYFEIANLLEKGMPWFVEKELYNKPNEIIKMFQEHSEDKEQKDRAKWAFKVLKKMANKNLVELMIRALRSENSITQHEAYVFIKNMSTTPIGFNFNKKMVKGLSGIDNVVANNLKNELARKI